MNEKKIILFDGVCNFCNFWVNFILDRDKNNIFKFAALQSEAGQELLHKFGLSTSDFDTFILIEGNKYFTKSTAVFKIIKKLSSFVKVFYPFVFLPKFFRDFLYNFIAGNRYRIFGKRDACRIPTPEEREKFL